ncbi:HM13 [Lepeophtheirus salmonis]|uniref:HM13 n=1 Tax=Lepeophtheirus salmonis TaxID=72036 RepID=A0A7R8DA11_LEPSM|nr:HM13 [Lepeophtheirus salmonis]CAF3022342.1 HM13 [Lepeophtheirus salmonis]
MNYRSNSCTADGYRVYKLYKALKIGTKVPATLEGTVMAYGALLIMALVPIFFGSFRSVDSHKEQVENSERTGEKPETMTSHDAAIHDIVALALSSVLGVWYLFKKHWIANNIFGLAFAINGIELLHLNNVMTGCILLGGLFFYDVFWVFGTNVMVTVATNFEAPIKLVFPQDLMEKGVFGASNMAMLGLGDIVIPGIFVALLLRYDRSLNRKSNFTTFTLVLSHMFLDSSRRSKILGTHS